jgi:protein-L-isoaspartate O-methyltransferase
MTPAMAIDLENARERIVLEQLERRGIRDLRVLAAMRTVPRHRRRAARPMKQESWLN